MALDAFTTTDDDGSGLIGTVYNNAWLQTLLAEVNTYRPNSLTPTAPTGTQNNYSPTGWGGNGISQLRLTNSSDVTLTGLAALATGSIVIIQALGTGNVYLAHQNASSSAANRFQNMATSGNTPLAAGVGVAAYVYDASGFWRLLWHEQGGPIEYSASSTITGWSAFTTKTIRYALRGREVTLFVDLEGTSNATTVSFTVPLTAANVGVQIPAAVAVTDNGAAQAAFGMARIVANGSTVSAFKDASGTGWTASGTKVAQGHLRFDAQ